MSGATLALMAAPGMTVRLSVTSDTESGVPDNNTFSPANTAIVDGGSGTYTYLWSFPTSANGTFAFGTGTASGTTISVSAVPSLDTADATVICTVTDTLKGTVVASASAHYFYQRLS